MTGLPLSNDSSVAIGFAALNLSEPVMRALDEIGYSDPTPVQAATYPLAITGRDIIVQARTGTGKTAAFGIPLVDKLVNGEPGVQALVLAPTRELAVQSQREIARLGQHRGLHTVAIYGGAPMGRQIEELQGGAQIVSGTPGRVLDHLRRGTLDASRLRVLILDEMDEMLSMGFAKELNAILELIPPRGKRQTMCFSATVDGEVRRHAERHMHEPEMVSLSSDAIGVEQISHFTYMVSGSDRTGDLIRVLEVEDPESALIFCNMRSETERVATSLQQAGFNADWLNGDLPQRDRERIMADTREGKLRYLVATDVAARGIDISHLTHVINYTFPESAAVYVHRTGRTGRAGRTGCAISLVGPEELGRLYYLRLEFKISPIERSLPTHGELKTLQELDRVGLLASAFVDAPNTTDLAVARRLLTHPDVERILAGLMHTFFGTHDDVDGEAAAARRTRQPRPVRGERDERDGPTDRADRGDANRGDANRGDRGAGPSRRDRDPAGSAPRERPARPLDRQRPKEQTARPNRAPRVEQDASSRDRSAARGGEAAEPQSERPPRPERTARGPERSRQRHREREPEAAPAAKPVAARGLEDRGDRSVGARASDIGRETSFNASVDARFEPGEPTHAASPDEVADVSARHAGLLYLNLGKRDGVRAGEVVRLLQENCELAQADIGRIRVRDRYTFVDVPEERLETIIAALSGRTLNDKALAPERAKSSSAKP